MEEGSSNKGLGFFDLIGRFVSGRRKITADEIHELIEASEEKGLVNEKESEMIRSIFSLRTRVVREIMIPRTEMACIAVDAGLEELLGTIITCGHSRIPVYENTVDNIIGIIYAKDLLRYMGNCQATIEMRAIMRIPFFIPETKNLEELLQEFKRKHVHMAVVIDEYGGTSGLVTIEDLLEEIVGDIQDEYDQEDVLFTVEPDGSLTADARMPVEELEEYLGIEIERDNFDSVGGLIFHLIGKIPATGDRVTGAGLQLEVLEADERRIKKVSIRQLNNNNGERSAE